MGIRSLYAGVSGLRNFQLQLDVIGNNIANSQTAGFKATRVTFEDLLNQTVQGATAPDGNTGGTNPQQFGLGSGIGAIDTNYSQGNLLTTGRELDLAISGNGFYKLSDGSDSFYTRNGAFDIDEDGYLVSTSNGLIVQGYNADVGVLDRTAVGNVQIPIGIVLPADETTNVDLVGNLNSTAEQVGSIHESEQLLATELAANDNDVDGLFAVGGLNTRISGLQPGVTTVEITYNDGSGGAGTATFTYVTTDAAASNGQFNSIEDLRQEINNTLGGASNFAAAALTATGQIALNNSGGTAGTIQILSNNSSLNSALSSLGGAYAGGATLTSDQFTHTATEADLLLNVRNSSGTNLGITGGITVSGDIGGNANTPGTPLAVGAATTLGNLCDYISTNLSITNSNNVEVVNGRVSINGDGGTDYELSNIDISSGDVVFDSVFDNSSGNWSRLQSAQDNHTTSFVAHDSDGVKHTYTIKYNIRESSGGAGQWVYNVSSVETATGVTETVDPANGSISFNPDGSILSFAPSQVTIYPAGIGNPISLTMDYGTIDGYDGLVSFENESSARFADITGFASGELQNISINDVGVVIGNFTNGENMILSQIVLSSFDNPEGLEKLGSNLFSETLNSGAAVDAEPGAAGRGTLIASTLESSNVDLANEFVNLITAQRGFQASSRMISTANEILGELVNLVR